MNLNALFFSIAQISGLLSLLILPLLLLRPWLRQWIGSQWLCVLWLLLLGRLLMPFPFASSFSIGNLWIEQEKPAVTLPIKAAVTTSPTPVESPLPTASHSPLPPTPQVRTNSDLIGAVWATGLLFGIAGLGVRLWKTRKLQTLTFPVTNEQTLAVYESIPTKLRGNIQLRTTTALNIPTIAGLFCPQIWLPLDWEQKLTADELRQVFLHELGHAQRRDLWVQWLFTVAQCIHWFNPLVWILARCAKLDREMACDAWVLTHSGAPSEYGETLLKIVGMLSKSPRTAPGGIAMAISKRNLTTRIAGIGAFRVRPLWSGIIGVLIVLVALTAVTSIGVSGEKSPNQDKDSSLSSPGPSKGTPEDQVQLVEIKTKFVEIPESVFNELIAPGGTLAKALSPKYAENNHFEQSGIAIIDTRGQETLLRTLGQTHGVYMLSAPALTTRSKKRGSVELGSVKMIREFRHPTKFIRNNEIPPQYTGTDWVTTRVGATLTATPTVEGDGKTISIRLVPSVVELKGYLDPDGNDFPGDPAPKNWTAFDESSAVKPQNQ